MTNTYEMITKTTMSSTDITGITESPKHEKWLIIAMILVLIVITITIISVLFLIKLFKGRKSSEQVFLTITETINFKSEKKSSIISNVSLNEQKSHQKPKHNINSKENLFVVQNPEQNMKTKSESPPEPKVIE